MSEGFFSRLPLNRIARCIAAVTRKLAPDGRFYVTWFENPDPRSFEPIDRNGFTTFPDAEPYHYPFQMLASICDAIGARAEKIQPTTAHPRGESLVMITPEPMTRLRPRLQELIDASSSRTVAERECDRCGGGGRRFGNHGRCSIARSPSSKTRSKCAGPLPAFSPPSAGGPSKRFAVSGWRFVVSRWLSRGLQRAVAQAIDACVRAGMRRLGVNVAGLPEHRKRNGRGRAAQRPIARRPPVSPSSSTTSRPGCGCTTERTHRSPTTIRTRSTLSTSTPTTWNGLRASGAGHTFETDIRSDTGSGSSPSFARIGCRPFGSSMRCGCRPSSGARRWPPSRLCR